MSTHNSTVIEDAVNYNLKASIDINMSVGEDTASAMWESHISNLGKAETSKQLVDTNAQREIVQPNLNVFKQLDALHLPITGGLVLERYMERDTDCFSSGSSGLTYRVSNAKLRTHLIPMTNEHIQKLMLVAQKGQIVYNYSQDYHTSRSYSSASDSINIQYKVASANSVTAVRRLSTDANDVSKKYIEKFQNLAGLTSLQVEHGSDKYPNQAYDDTVQVYRALRKELNSANDVDSSNQLTRALFNAIDANDETAPLFIFRQRLDRAGQHTGINTDNAPIVIRSSQTALSNGVVDVFVNYSVSLSVFGPRQALVSKLFNAIIELSS